MTSAMASELVRYGRLRFRARWVRSGNVGYSFYFILWEMVSQHAQRSVGWIDFMLDFTLACLLASLQGGSFIDSTILS